MTTSPGASRRIEGGGSVFTYSEAGAGTPLVLLHGIGSAARAFDDQLAGLSDRLRVIAWDAPGYGGSTCLAPESPRANDYAAALGAMLDALGIPACHLVGHSLGTLIAASFAADHPERILSLTLASVAAGQARLPAAEREKALAQRLGARDLLFNPAGRPHYFRNDGVTDAEFTMVVGSGAPESVTFEAA